MTSLEYNQQEISYIIHTIDTCIYVDKGIANGKVVREHIKSYTEDNIRRLQECTLKLRILRESITENYTIFWQPIENAPKDSSFILIRKDNCIPDLVQWLPRHNHRCHDADSRTFCFDVPEGWFRRSGERSPIIYPDEFFTIPDK